ncbi:hypothetical protein GQ600_23976 [Phytophthora cactorum]|nr:hypothetical protein GQ600_16528 [Phytophthora cactorum]KAF1775267.1 hypothetical protein GQ600_23976 [Phytophthora cactorum]
MTGNLAKVNLPFNPDRCLLTISSCVLHNEGCHTEERDPDPFVTTLGPSPRTSLTKCRPSSENNDSSVTPGEECHYPAEGLPPLGLGLGSAESPLLYCKHQAPVPPKDKTPRKLWNAIGGEDRRLIVLQRNHLPPC